jgi:hypothetical protein
MKEEIEDLMHEAEIVIRDAYQRGFDNGNISNKAVLESKRYMLRAFDSYANKYIRLTGDDNGSVFVPRQPEGMRLGITLDTLVKNFLLSYDDEGTN